MPTLSNNAPLHLNGYHERKRAVLIHHDWLKTSVALITFVVKDFITKVISQVVALRHMS